MYKIIDLQGAELMENVNFETKEQIRQHLINFHSQDFCGEIEALNNMTIEEVCEFGSWEVVGGGK